MWPDLSPSAVRISFSGTTKVRLKRGEERSGFSLFSQRLTDCESRVTAEKGDDKNGGRGGDFCCPLEELLSEAIEGEGELQIDPY